MSTEARAPVEDVEGLLRALDEPCDHKRATCEEVGCNGPMDRRVAATLRELSSLLELERIKAETLLEDAKDRMDEATRRETAAIQERDYARRRADEAMTELEERIRETAKVSVERIVAEAGSIDVVLKTEILPMLVEMFATAFEEHDATNYLEMKMVHDRLGLLTVRIQKHDGITPHEAREAAEAALEEARRERPVAAWAIEIDGEIEELHHIRPVISFEEGVCVVPLVRALSPQPQEPATEGEEERHAE